MAKRSTVERDSDIRVEDSEAVSDDIVLSVRLVLLRNIKLKIRGPVTNTEYIFDGAGSFMDVDATDAPGMLAKRSASSCCSGHLSPYFAVGG